MIWLTLYLVIGGLWGGKGLNVFYAYDPETYQNMKAFTCMTINAFLWPIGLLTQTFFFITNRTFEDADGVMKKEIAFIFHRLGARANGETE